MKFYVAGSFSGVADVEETVRWLERDGHYCVDVWWNTNADRDGGLVDTAIWDGQPAMRAIAKRHWAAIQEADVLVLVGDLAVERPEPRRFTGANIEVGYAIAHGKPVVVIGSVKRSAMYAECLFARGIGKARNLFKILDRGVGR